MLNLLSKAKWHGNHWTFFFTIFTTSDPDWWSVRHFRANYIVLYNFSLDSVDSIERRQRSGCSALILFSAFVVSTWVKLVMQALVIRDPTGSTRHRLQRFFLVVVGRQSSKPQQFRETCPTIFHIQSIFRITTIWEPWCQN